MLTDLSQSLTDWTLIETDRDTVDKVCESNQINLATNHE